MNIYDIPYTAQIRIQQAYMVKQAQESQQSTVTLTAERPTLSHHIPSKLYTDKGWIADFQRLNGVSVNKLRSDVPYKIPQRRTTQAQPVVAVQQQQQQQQKPYHDSKYFTFVTGSKPLATLNGGVWSKAMTDQIQALNGVNLNKLRHGMQLKIPATKRYQQLYKHRSAPMTDWRYTGNLWDDRQLVRNALISAQSGGRNVRTRGGSTALGKGMTTELKIRDYIARYPQLAKQYGAFVDEELSPIFEGIKKYNRLSRDKNYKGPLDHRFSPDGKLPFTEKQWKRLDQLSDAMLYIDIKRAQAAKDGSGNPLSSHDALMRMIKGWRGKSYTQDPAYYHNIYKIIDQLQRAREISNART